MATGLAVAGIGLALYGSGQGAAAQRHAGEAQKAAGEATAKNILFQSEETKRRMKEAQRGTLGTAIARAAASGVTVDAEALKKIKYEFEYETPEMPEGPGDLVLTDPVTAFFKRGEEAVEEIGESFEDIGEQIEGIGDDIEDAISSVADDVLGSIGLGGGDGWNLKSKVEELARREQAAEAAKPTVGKLTSPEPPPPPPGGAPITSSLEAYIHAAKSIHAREIAWEDAWAESQANAARLGGQVAFQTAQAQAQASQVQAWSSAAMTGASLWASAPATTPTPTYATPTYGP